MVRKLDKKNEFSGRTGIYETLVVDDEIKKLIHENKSENEIKKISNKKFDSIYQDGLKKVEKGITSEVELKRVLKESE